ncbi:hypothetical protein E0Z10_g2215 [Xylaria hypoxylon]|uniref:Chromo domain-containing protein n=1 Tax=Xylaria hypoxylon TaxID=37992 RepID=A0A4Z0Z4R6_9PEZI|nr:hypothetical protein E0Z10_g2215 [Xylaria hypoxylon]
MNTVGPERLSIQQQTHDNQTLPRGRPRLRLRPSPSPSPNPNPNPESKPKPRAKKPKLKTTPEHDEGWFTIRDIIDEKTERGRILYLIDWDGTDQSGRRYEPTWEPATNVTVLAINAWRDKKNKAASEATGAPDHDEDPQPQPSTQETDPVQAHNWRRENRKIGRRFSDGAVRSLDDTGEGARKRRRTDGSPTASRLRVPHVELTHQSILSSASLDTGNPEAGLVAKTRGAQIVVELPGAPTFDPSEFRAIPPSHASQSSSQATLPERMRLSGTAVRDQRVIPDSQEISGTSASEAHNSHQEPADSFVESQLSGEPPALPGPLETSRASSSSGIPSHQPESRSRFVGISGFFANPSISTNPGVNASLGFQTQLELDLDTVDATPATTSHNTTVPASLSQNPGVQASQRTETQHSQITNGGSTSSNSQAAQIVQPLTSHPHDATSQSQTDFSVFDEDRTVPETVPGDNGTQVDSQDSSQALSELDGNIRITSKGHESAPSPGQRQESRSAIRNGDKPSLRCATADLSQEARPVTPTNMDGTSAAETPLSAKERLRLFREGHFNKSSVTGSTSPAVLSPVPLDNTSYVAHNPTPQAEVHVDSERPSTIDVPPPAISPLLLLPSGAAQAQTELPFESAQARIGSNPPLEHISIDPVSLSSYDTSQIEQPATLDPSNLTLSIENDVDGSPSVPTDDGFAPGPLPGSTNSDEYETQEEYPRSLLPHVPTGPSEYLITLPFQTSSRPQYNDIIRENEALINEYNAAFRTLPHKTPRRDVVEKLDIMFTRLFDICDFPPFLDSLPSMSAEQTTKHVIGTNAKFSFVAELLDNLRGLNSDKKVLILVRPGKLMDLLGHVIQSRSCHYIRSGREVVSAADAKHPLTVSLCSTLDEESSSSRNADVVVAFDHTFRQGLVSPTDQSATPILLALVTIASIQHINMRIMENLQPLERKNVLMLALVKAMRSVEEPDPSESLFSIAEKFTRRIQMPEDDEDDFYWEPQSVPIDIFDDLYAASSQIEATQLSSQDLSTDQQPGSRKRSYVDDDNDESLPKRPKMAQPQVVTSASHISDALRNLLGDDFAQISDKATIAVPVDKLQALTEKFAELESKLGDSKAREDGFRQLSDRNQKEANSYRSSINNIQTKYMDALKERGIFEADCKIAQEQASVLGGSLESCRAEIAKLKATRTELEKKLAEANDALLHSSIPDLVRMAEMERNLTIANARVEDLNKKVVVMQSDTDYRQNLYNQASQRAAEMSSENRGYEKKIQELQRKADDNIIEVNKVQSRNEVRILSQQVKEQKNLVREREAELSRVKEDLKSLKSGRRETRQSSVPRSPRLHSLGIMSPRNGTRGPSAMGGPSSSRGTSPQPPVAVFDGPVGPGNGVQNAAMFNQGPTNRFAHLRDQRF